MLLDEADEGNAHARDPLNETGVKLQLILCFEQSRIVYRTFRILRVSLMEDYKESLCARVQSATLLWDPTHQDYKNKDQRQQVWDEIDRTNPARGSRFFGIASVVVYAKSSKLKELLQEKRPCQWRETRK